MPADWDKVVLKYIKKTNPYCMLSCDQNRIKSKFQGKEHTIFSRNSEMCLSRLFSVCCCENLAREL